MKKIHVKAFVIILLISAVAVVLIRTVKNSQKLNGSSDCIYDSSVSEWKLDDYVVARNEKGIYCLTNVKTGATKPLFNDPLKNTQYSPSKISVSGNKVYFLNRRILYCYDADKDSVEEIYEYKLGYYLKVFDVIVFHRLFTPEVREAQLENMFVARGNVVIVKDTGIDIYDGRKTTTIISGEYSVLSYKDGIMKYRTNNTKEITKNYEYDFDTGKITELEEGL